MTASALAIIGATIVFSSFISGVFGMAGGMVLLGVILRRRPKAGLEGWPRASR